MSEIYIETNNSAKETSANIVQYHNSKSIEDTNTVDNLHSAVKIGDLSLITRLIHEGADLNARDEYGQTPLHSAVHSRNVDVVRCLGANYDINEWDGPVSCAFQHGYVELVRYFIEEVGIDPMTANERGCTLIGQAVMGGDLYTIEYLLNRKGAVYDGSNLLGIAIACDHLHVVKYLVWEKEVDINFAEENGWAPLLYAVERDELEIVGCLIEGGADVNATTEYGTTALHVAAEDCNLDMVKCLVINGANVNVRDKNDNTPLYLATQDREYQDKDIKEDVKEYLISRGAHI
ncbi:ankyrin repeat domain-containing protein [Wolbachia endosymbiont (group A) of Agelastica alni]|uniref:ankyrin repeat domain-containing protein n=1 Tax=Wolbachia endosymbiont (group A) of Agelastica alni TaxID=3066130 RepID=UPI00313353FD